MNSQKVWLITGASQGLGLLTVKYLLGKGQLVVATTRDQNSFDATLLKDDNLRVYSLDVTNEDAVQEVVEEVIATHGRIDVLINNAGFGFLGAVEEASVDEVNDVLAVNVLGTFNLMRQVLPYMRKEHSGHIINLSSASGLVSTPGFGIYNASKYAIEGLTEALKLEVKGLGIKVTLIEPGAFRTNFLGTSLRSAKKEIDDYLPTAGHFKTMFHHNNGKQLGNPERAVEALYAVTEMENPPLRLLLGSDAYTRVHSKLEQLLAEFDLFKNITFSTDFKN
ncbi:oxidoreductase [Sphingobacterium sp. MYb382]|uniref:oxidoreductase n=1 Tax=Sphingobacterium sp. MYb382 TaxID=2745278 RepID=UPI00309ADC16